jgi:hypothetical protein
MHRLTLDCHVAGSMFVNKKEAKIRKIRLAERGLFVYSTVTFSQKGASQIGTIFSFEFSELPQATERRQTLQ